MPGECFILTVFGIFSKKCELLIYHIDSILGIGYNESVGEIFPLKQGVEGGNADEINYFLPSGGMKGEKQNLSKK